MKYTKEYIDNYYKKIKKEKNIESKIPDKYSTNFLIWSKQCNKINRMLRKYKMMISQYNYEHGTAFIIEVIK